jgi:hypothetical protein
MSPFVPGIVSRVVVEVLGNNKPLVLLFNSRIELTLGVEVPIPTWADSMSPKPWKRSRRKYIFFIVDNFRTQVHQG